MVDLDNFDKILLWIMSTLMILLIIFLVVVNVFYLFSEKYEIERPCIDDDGGIFRDEVCEESVRCSFNFPGWLNNLVSNGKCKYVEEKLI